MIADAIRDVRTVGVATAIGQLDFSATVQIGPTNANFLSVVVTSIK